MTLKVQVSSCPQSAQKIVNSTVSLVEKTLKNLGYDGIWILNFVSHSKKRVDIKFQLVRKDGPSVRIRTKPGDNGSCWECYLSPPTSLKIDDVFNSLKLINPKTLKVQRVNQALQEVEKEVEKRKEQVTEGDVLKCLTSTPQTTQEIIENLYKQGVHNTSDLASILVTLYDRIAIEKDENNKWYKPEKSLVLDAASVDVNLNQCIYAKMKALTALSHIARQTQMETSLAIKTLIKKMRLETFAREHPKYSDPTKVAASIIRGLVEGEILERVRGKKLAITEFGFKRLQELGNNGWDIGLDCDMAISSKPLPKEPPEKIPAPKPQPPVTSDPTIDLIDRNKDQLAPLVAEHDKKAKSIESYQELVESIKSDINQKASLINNIQLEIDRTEIVLSEFNKRKEMLLKEKEEHEQDLVTAKSEIDFENEELNRIKQKLMEILQ
jgi:hypothetical protein